MKVSSRYLILFYYQAEYNYLYLDNLAYIWYNAIKRKGHTYNQWKNIQNPINTANEAG